MTINLFNNTAIGGHAQGDVISGFENIIGSIGTDNLTGNAADNHLFGNDGTDFLFGKAGFDTLDGGDGQDFLDGGMGDDTIIGGDKADTYIIASVDRARILPPSEAPSSIWLRASPKSSPSMASL